MSTSVDSPIRFRLRCAKTHWLLRAEARSGASIWSTKPALAARIDSPQPLRHKRHGQSDISRAP